MSNLDSLILTREELNIARSQVEEMAYYRWLYAGCPAGEDLRFWLEAELEWVGYRYCPHRFAEERSDFK